MIHLYVFEPVLFFSFLQNWQNMLDAFSQNILEAWNKQITEAHFVTNYMRLRGEFVQTCPAGDKKKDNEGNLPCRLSDHVQTRKTNRPVRRNLNEYSLWMKQIFSESSLYFSPFSGPSMLQLVSISINTVTASPCVQQDRQPAYSNARRVAWTRLLIAGQCEWSRNPLLFRFVLIKSWGNA